MPRTDLESRPRVGHLLSRVQQMIQRTGVTCTYGVTACPRKRGQTDLRSRASLALFGLRSEVPRWPPLVKKKLRFDTTREQCHATPNTSMHEIQRQSSSCRRRETERLRFDGLTRCPLLSETRSRYTLENSQDVQPRFHIASQRRLFDESAVEC